MSSPRRRRRPGRCEPVPIRNTGAERRSLAREETCRAIAEAALDAVILIDGSGTIHEWNPAAEGMFGYTREEALGQAVHALLAHPDTRDRYDVGLRHFVKTGEGTVVGKVLELEARHRDGRIIPVELSVAAYRLRGRWHAVGIVRDITARKALEADLARTRQQLASRVEELERAFSQVKRLEGFLPICSYCKRIRRDPHYWQQVEAYISEHADVLFSHGICPECMERELRAMGFDGGS